MKLKATSLDWALKHILRDGDTDLFPKPFEFDIAKKQWPALQATLVNIDINGHQWQGTRRLVVPKSDFAFRSITQLDPLDSILFAAIVKEVGIKIEKRRPKYADGIVFSYRFDPSATGRLYSENSGWEDFWKKTEEHCSNYKYVLVTDISDWYNQIYHHTIENQLQQSNVDINYWYAIKNLIANSSEGVSRGIPIGPHPSHLLAEMAMIPTDEFIKGISPVFCRYVDDIHIFCNSEAQANKILYQLADNLDKTQKIQLSRRKTKIFSSDIFLKTARENAVDKPINSVEKEMLAAVRSYTSSPYQKVPISVVQPIDMAKLSKENIESVVTEYLKSDPIDYVRLRWFIRRLAQIGASGGVEVLVKKFGNLMPAVADVAQYFESATKNYNGSWSDIGDELLWLYESDVVQASEYLKVIILSLFSRIVDLNHTQKITALYSDGTAMTKRKIVLAAANAKMAGWLSGLKGDYKNADPWLRRALIYSMRALPKDERTFWLKSVNKRVEGFDVLVAKSIA